MTEEPTEQELDALVARFEKDERIDDETARLLGDKRALLNAWLRALKRRLAALIVETKRAREEGSVRLSALERRLALEKSVLRSLNEALQTTAPMPCLKFRVRPPNDDDD